MKTYKDFESHFIGSSDIASLVMVGYKNNEGIVPMLLNFGEDNRYKAYIVDEPNVEIGAHYREQFGK